VAIAIDAHPAGYVYIYKSGNSNAFKIGKTVDLARRKKALVTGNPEPLVEFDVIETDGPAKVETYRHHRLRSRKVAASEGNEWFELDPDELRDVIRDARHYADEVLPVIADAELLAGVECDDRVLSPQPPTGSSTKSSSGCERPTRLSNTTSNCWRRS